MSDLRSLALDYASQHADQFLSDLQSFLTLPSISTDPDRKADMQRTAEQLAARLKALDFVNISIFPTAGHPVVYGELPAAAVNPMTLLVYGHYDVQPVEPLDLWENPPFEPTQVGDALFARGASDMKGQIMAALDAIEAITRTGRMPVNIKVMFEGEEEIGSPSLGAFLREHKNLLKCDLVLNPDTSMVSPETPAIVYALRGLAYFEVRVYGPEHDLHSGSFGGVVHNPAQALCELVAGMHDSHGRITLPGFYNRVKELGEVERSELARLPIDDAYYQAKTGAPALWGEEGYSPVERIGARPTLEVNGILSGFTGAGSKTVIPAWAMAKISMRLVPDQDPEEVHRQLNAYLKAHAPNTIRWEVIAMAGGPACIADRNNPGTLALSRALEAVWGSKPVFKREGGSVPVVNDMLSILGVDSVLTGFGLPDDNIHAPNEKLHLPTWRRGIAALIHFLYNLGEL
jgi:acetylornithine deacetylase/succinyl-diaminopimelate desuccinylase-like protein